MPDETIANGEPVYDADGTELGVVSGASTDGITVSIRAEVEYVETDVSDDGSPGGVHVDSDDHAEIDPEEHDPGPEFGAGFIMWRCANCGEMGELEEGFPDVCPNCGADEVNKWKED